MAHKTPPEPDVPACVEHVLDTFWHLNSQRRSGFNGAEAIGWSEIAAWCDLMDMQLVFEELQMIVALDSAYRDEIAIRQAAAREERKNQKPA